MHQERQISLNIGPILTKDKVSDNASAQSDGGLITLGKRMAVKK